VVNTLQPVRSSKKAGKMGEAALGAKVKMTNSFNSELENSLVGPAGGIRMLED
jgi:hypothetical protein